MEHKELVLPYHDYIVSYQILVPLVDAGGGNYCTHYKGIIKETDGSLDSDNDVIIGRITLTLNHIGIANEHHFPLYEISDSFGLFLNIDNIFNHENRNYTSEFLSLQKHPIVNPDILKIDMFEIVPMYRKLGIGTKVLQHIFHHFKNACGIIIGYVEPHQFSRFHVNHPHDKFFNDMKYHTFGNDEEMAFYKLMKLFTDSGFSIAKGVNEKIVFLNTQARFSTDISKFMVI